MHNNHFNKSRILFENWTQPTASFAKLTTIFSRKFVGDVNMELELDIEGIILFWGNSWIFLLEFKTTNPQNTKTFAWFVENHGNC